MFEMGKNIVVFSDGTGQDGGVKPEQRMSNIYKMFRATKLGPDSKINPADQIAFYDPGLGTDADSNGFTWIGHRIHKALASLGGRGITHNIADCYEFIINHWLPGDRIFIFGFSRGAYTARCLAQVLALCGVPQHAADQPDIPIKRFSRETQKLALSAVREVYEHGAGFPRDDYEDERQEKGRRFRAKYGSDDAGIANAHPHFIGVFDTVAALGVKGWKRLGIWLALGLFVIFAAIILASIVNAFYGYLWRYAIAVVATLIGFTMVWLRCSSLRTITDYPNKGDPPRSHHINWRADNYDRGLSGHVGYARHASAIDERRADFPRVQWGKDDAIRARIGDEPDPLVQLFFAGNHSDIGGSYSEEESRLSDVALEWMIDEAVSIPGPLIVDRSRLQVRPASDGMQHCEIDSVRDRYLWWVPAWAPSWLKEGWTTKLRVSRDFPMHPSVIERFAAKEVIQCGKTRPYRPVKLEHDQRFTHFYGGRSPLTSEIIDQHRQALYRVKSVPEILLKVDETSPELVKLMESRGASTAAFIAAWNPYGIAAGTYFNNLAHKRLTEYLRELGVEHIDAAAEYQPDESRTEPGFFVLGIDRTRAEEIGRRYGQNAILWIEGDGIPRLVVLQRSTSEVTSDAAS